MFCAYGLHISPLWASFLHWRLHIFPQGASHFPAGASHFPLGDFTFLPRGPHISPQGGFTFPPGEKYETHMYKKNIYIFILYSGKPLLLTAVTA